MLVAAVLGGCRHPDLVEFITLNGGVLPVIIEMRFFVMEEMPEMFFSVGILTSVLIGWPKLQFEENTDDQDIRSGENAR